MALTRLTRAQELKYRFDPELWCSVLRAVGHGGIDLQPERHGARLYCAPGEAPDMTATIRAVLIWTREIHQ